MLRWFLRNYPGVTNAEFYRLARSGQIRLNSKRVSGTEVLRAGDVVRIPPGVPSIREKRKAKSENGTRFSLADLEVLRRAIIHSDDDIVVFNKPAGLAVQGGTGIAKSIDKMAAALFPYDRISLVHRLDRETSGVLVVAKNHNAAQNLTRQFQDKTAHKKYLALLSGRVMPKSGIIDNIMIKGRVLAENEKAPIGPRPQRAITEYRVISDVANILSWVLFMPKTGRTHQLRLHSAFTLGAPIIGDNLYGRPARLDKTLSSMLNTKNLFLFAYMLTFKHPTTGREMTLRAEMPEYMQSVIKFLELTIPE